MREEIITVAAADVPFNIQMTGISYCDGGYRIRRGKSDIVCVEYIVSGSGSVICNGRRYYPKAGDMYMLPVGSEHIYYSDAEDPWVKIWFNASGELAERLPEMYSLGHRILFEGTDGSKYIKNIGKICANDEFTPYEMQKRCAAEFFALVGFLAENSGNDAKYSDAKTVRNYIDRNITRPITLHELAELISKSTSQTIRCFKKEYGKTPYEYVLEEKIIRAKMLLKNTNMNVRNISEALSFGDEHYFSGLFRQKTGMTPTEFRRI